MKISKEFPSKEKFYSLLKRLNFDAVACYLLLNHFLLVIKFSRSLQLDLLVTHGRSCLLQKPILYGCKNFLLLVAEVARCKNHSLFVAKLAYYWLQKFLVVEIHSLPVAEVARCKNYLWLVAKFTRYSLQQITHYSLQKALVAKNCSVLVKPITSQ